VTPKSYSLGLELAIAIGFAALVWAALVVFPS
jgi:hypothetical protein